MASLVKQYRWGFAIAAAAVVALAGVLFGPTLRLRWNYHTVQSQYQARLAQQARELLPELTKSTYAPLHFRYQDLMKDAGHSSEAVRQYKTWVEADSKNAALHALYSRIQQDTQRKEASLVKAFELDPKNETLQFVQIETILNAGKTAEAQKILTGIQADHWLRWLMEARIAARLGDIQRAKEAFEKTLTDGAVPISAAIEYARFLTLSTNLKEGGIPNPFAKWRVEILQQEPVAYAYYTWLTLKPLQETAASLSEDFLMNPEALALFCRPALLESASIDDSLPDAVTNRKPLDEASRLLLGGLLEKAARIAPKNPEVLIGQGLFALSKKEVSEKDRQEALQLFSTGLQNTQPSEAAFYTRMGDNLTAIGRYDLAVSHYKKAWGDIPEYCILLNHLADARIHEKNYPETIKILAKTLLLIPRDVSANRKMAETYLAIDEPDKARKYYGDLIEIDEHDRSARDKIAEIWMKKGNSARALQIYRALLNRDPENGYCYAQMARILLKSGSAMKADAYLRQVKEEHPNVRDMEEILRAINEIELAKKQGSN